MATASAALEAMRASLWRQPEFSFIPDRDVAPLQGRATAGNGPRVLFAGFPSDFSLAFLLGLLELDVQVVALLTSPGAHEAILGDNALSRVADHLDIPLLRAWRVNDEHTISDIAGLRVEAAVMASFDQIIRSRLLAMPPCGWMNVHPSALPARRGPEPVYWTIAEGDALAGITLHRAVPKVDAGPMLAQRRMEVHPDDTAGRLTKRLCEAGVAVLPDALRRQLAGDPGDALDLTGATYAPPVGHRHLDTADSAVVAERMVRAGMPNMPAWTEIDGVVMYVQAAARPASSTHPQLHFADGDLALTKLSAACGCHHNLVSCPHLER